MNFYKITNKNENHKGMQYKTGLNVDIQPFNPSGNCQSGGIYFSREDILAFLGYGCWIRKVTLPEDAQVYENPGAPKKWKANRVILGRKYKITSKIIQRLIDEGADVHADNDYAIRWASGNGHTKTVKLLLENGANIHADNDYAIRLTSENGHTKIVKLLLENGADVHANNDYAIRWASINGHTEVVKLLKEWIKNENCS